MVIGRYEWSGRLRRTLDRRPAPSHGTVSASTNTASPPAVVHGMCLIRSPSSSENAARSVPSMPTAKRPIRPRAPRFSVRRCQPANTTRPSAMVNGSVSLEGLKVNRRTAEPSSFEE
ncbi:MAG: hypothetical protein AMS14_08525 [Planctomycetes bacterium DG_20]|nr:MAG: hypothetical protein AMS14_08525 [Planctomycetes bacterium DG_20]